MLKPSALISTLFSRGLTGVSKGRPEEGLSQGKFGSPVPSEALHVSSDS